MKLDLDEPEDKISRESDEGSMTSGSISGSTFSGSQILTGSNFSGQILSGTSDSPANGDVSALKRQKQELEIKLREEVSERSVQKKLIQYGRGWGESNNEKGTQDYYNKAFCQKIKFLFIYLSYYLSKLSIWPFPYRKTLMIRIILWHTFVPHFDSCLHSRVGDLIEKCIYLTFNVETFFQFTF
jgi:hypothetical protein